VTIPEDLIALDELEQATDTRHALRVAQRILQATQRALTAARQMADAARRDADASAVAAGVLLGPRGGRKFEVYDEDGNASLDSELRWDTRAEADAAKETLWIVDKRVVEVRECFPWPKRGSAFYITQGPRSPGDEPDEVPPGSWFVAVYAVRADPRGEPIVWLTFPSEKAAWEAFLDFNLDGT